MTDVTINVRRVAMVVLAWAVCMTISAPVHSAGAARLSGPAPTNPAPIGPAPTTPAPADLALCAEAPPALPALDPAAAANVSFRRDVWPIVKRHCWGCHSGDKPKGGLSMDSVADMLKGGDTDPLFTPGKPDSSLLVKMITGDKPDMPRKQPPLSAAKILALRLWVLGGAKDDSTPGDRDYVVRIPQTYSAAPPVSSVAFSPDGKLVAAACRSEVVLIDVATAAPTRRLATECDLVTHVEFSPDGKLLAAAGGSPARYGEVRFFNPADGAVVASRRLTHDTLFRGNFAPDSTAIALGGADGAIHIVPVDPKAELRAFDLHSDWCTDVAYSPDGKLLVSGGRDKATKVSSARTGRLLRAVDLGDALISGVAADDAFAVSVGRQRQLNAYELKIALSGVDIAGNGGNGLQPDTKKSQYLKGIESEPGEVLDMAVSADHKLIAVAGAFGEVRVYQIADRKRIATVANVPAPVYSVALDAAGAHLAVGSFSGQVLIYELPSGKQLASLTPVPVQPQKVAAKP